MLCMIIELCECIWTPNFMFSGPSVPSRSASALRPSGTPPVTHLGSMHIHYLVDVSIFDCGCSSLVFPKPPSVSGARDDLRSHIVFQHFQGSSQRRAGEAKMVTM